MVVYKMNTFVAVQKILICCGIFICLFCFSGIAEAKVYFSLNVEPQTAEDANPVFSMYQGLDKISDIQSGGSMELKNNNNYKLLIPDISSATGCGMPINEDIQSSDDGDYIEINTG
ncbi:MAG: hypothetical protein LC657_03290, partial [Desulfobacteraceae bacterium]|nr:hypothetical protein [Desulfobacteraceae bacterium]